MGNEEKEESEGATWGLGLSQEQLKKYILFCKQTCHPKLDNIDRDKIAEFYSELRQSAMVNQGGITIAVRHIESILRLSEARAKLHLREYVRSDDVDMAIRILLESFIDTQKKSIQAALKKHFKQYLNYDKDTNQLLLHLLNEEIDEELKWKQITSRQGNMDSQADDQSQVESIEINLKDFESRIAAVSITNTNLMQFLRSQKFKDRGFK